MKMHSHLKALHYFLVSARCLSIKQAAEELFVTQAAISQQIRLLEEALGMALFHRHHRALALTPEGLQLLPYLETAFGAIEQGIDGLMVDNDPNTITLSVFPSFGSRWLIPRLGSFYKEHPSISINLSMSDKYEAFGSKGIDLAIRFGSGQYQDIKSRFLMKDYIYPACHPSYLEEHGIESLSALKELRLLDDIVSDISWDYWLEQKGIDRHEVESSAEVEKSGVKGAHNRMRYDGSHYVIDAALSAQGVAMVRHCLVADAVAQKQLVRLFGEPAELSAQYFLCAPEHYFQYPKIKTFERWLIRQVDEFSRQYPVMS